MLAGSTDHGERGKELAGNESIKAKSRTLIVEDETPICARLSEGLSAVGFECRVANSCSVAMDILEIERVDALGCGCVGSAACR